MAELILVTGGSRSGKSDYARNEAERIDGPRVFVATCPVIDEEMSERIRRHRLERDESAWVTVEETENLVEALRGAHGFRVALVDCLTLWVNNLMYSAGREGRTIDEDEISRSSEELVSACRGFDGAVIMVTNEVGMGIVPENREARLYRDLVGRCNRIIAEAADRVVLVSCGIPLQLR